MALSMMFPLRIGQFCHISLDLLSRLGSFALLPRNDRIRLSDSAASFPIFFRRSSATFALLQPAAAPSRAPDIFKRLRRHSRVADRVGDAGVAEEVLQAPRVHSACRQGIAGRVTEHMHVNGKR
jgi:hypothetical protein